MDIYIIPPAGNFEKSARAARTPVPIRTYIKSLQDMPLLTIIIITLRHSLIAQWPKWPLLTALAWASWSSRG